MQRSEKYASYSSDIVSENTWVKVLRLLIRNKPAMIAFSVFTLVCFSCLFAPYLTKWKYTEINLEHKLEQPSFTHIFGTDSLGRDMLSRILYGGRFTLKIALTSTLLATIAGSFLGLVIGYFASWADAVITPALDVIASIPVILLAIVTEATFGWGHGYFMYAMAVAAVPQFASLASASVISIKKYEYIEAARALGVGNTRILLKHVLRNVAPQIILRFTMGVAEALLTCTIIGYLQIGITPPTPEWGAIVLSAKGQIRVHPFLMIIPCAVIAITVISINLFGDGLRDALDPANNVIER